MCGVLPAASFLLMVSVLDLLGGLYNMVNAIFLKQTGPEAAFQKAWDKLDPFLKKLMEKGGWTAQSFHAAMANVQLGWGAVAALVSVLMIAGSRHMLALQSYRLAMTAAVLTAIPCVTPCCLVGQVAGLWAILILVQPDVRTAFH